MFLRHISPLTSSIVEMYTALLKLWRGEHATVEESGDHTMEVEGMRGSLQPGGDADLPVHDVVELLQC